MKKDVDIVAENSVKIQFNPKGYVVQGVEKGIDKGVAKDLDKLETSIAIEILPKLKKDFYRVTPYVGNVPIEIVENELSTQNIDQKLDQDLSVKIQFNPKGYVDKGVGKRC